MRDKVSMTLAMIGLILLAGCGPDKTQHERIIEAQRIEARDSAADKRIPDINAMVPDACCVVGQIDQDDDDEGGLDRHSPDSSSLSKLINQSSGTNE